MKWQDLTAVQRALAIAGGVVLFIALIAAAFALGRSGAEDPEATAEPTATVEATAPVEPVTPSEPPEEEPAPVTPAPPPAPEPEPEPTVPGRLFGQLKAIRDESGGAWQELRIDIDEAEFLSGDAARDWLESEGEGDFYAPAYWYAKNTSPAVTTYPAVPSPGPAVWMYTWPVVPVPGFYGPGMSKQVVEFGMFYDRIYMYDDEAGLIDRYYWFTLDSGRITLIEEQPRDPFYEP